jgi:hypothetical protein
LREQRNGAKGRAVKNGTEASRGTRVAQKLTELIRWARANGTIATSPEAELWSQKVEDCLSPFRLL